MPISQVDARLQASHLRVNGVDAGYKGLAIIRDVSVCAACGEVVAVIGPNGAGKSTLLKAVMGVLQPMAGSITLGAKDIGGLRADEIARSGVGYVPQVRDVFEPLSVKENLEMGAYGMRRREIAHRIAEVVEAYPQLGRMMNRAAGNLSGGERKMVAIGRVMMTRPSLMILDEPTAGLSPNLAHQLLETYVRQLTDQGVAVLLVEQRARDALKISNFAYVMASGRVQFASAAAELLDRPDLGEVFLGKAAATVT